MSPEDIKEIFKNIKEFLLKIDSFIENHNKHLKRLEEHADFTNRPIPRILIDQEIQMQLDKTEETYLHTDKTINTESGTLENSDIKSQIFITITEKIPILFQ